MTGFAYCPECGATAEVSGSCKGQGIPSVSYCSNCGYKFETDDEPEDSDEGNDEILGYVTGSGKTDFAMLVDYIESELEEEVAESTDLDPDEIRERILYTRPSRIGGVIRRYGVEDGFVINDCPECGVFELTEATIGEIGMMDSRRGDDDE